VISINYDDDNDDDDDDDTDTLLPIGEQSIVMTVSVCLSVREQLTRCMLIIWHCDSRTHVSLTV